VWLGPRQRGDRVTVSDMVAVRTRIIFQPAYIQFVQTAAICCDAQSVAGSGQNPPPRLLPNGDGCSPISGRDAAAQRISAVGQGRREQLQQILDNSLRQYQTKPSGMQRGRASARAHDKVAAATSSFGPAEAAPGASDRRTMLSVNPVLTARRVRATFSD
jgi:hypothetical protein